MYIYVGTYLFIFIDIEYCILFSVFSSSQAVATDTSEVLILFVIWVGNSHHGWAFNKRRSLSVDGGILPVSFKVLWTCGQSSWPRSSIVCLWCEHHCSLHLISRCICTFENIFYLREIVSFKIIYFSNTLFGTDRIGLESAVLVPPRTHLGNSLSDITLWWLTPSNRFPSETWHAAVHGVARSWTRHSNWTTGFLSLCDGNVIENENNIITGCSYWVAPPKYSLLLIVLSWFSTV